jgi:hypothetical protein
MLKDNQRLQVNLQSIPRYPETEYEAVVFTLTEGRRDGSHSTCIANYLSDIGSGFTKAQVEKRVSDLQFNIERA